mgnify:CR=1 FL=1
MEIIVGASNGVWKYDTTWQKQTSSARQNAYLTGFWNGTLFEAFATSDGVSVKLGSTTFLSDFLKLTSNNVNGLFKGSYVKNSSGTVSEFESLHAAGDDGYYVMGNDTQYASFSSFLVPRKMFRAGNPDGVTKYYKSFQAYSVPSSTNKTTYANPLFIFTNDGILKIRNWKYSYPEDLNSSDFIVKKGKKYLGVSLKKKPLPTTGDPTLINKAFSSLLSGSPELKKVREGIEKDAGEFSKFLRNKYPGIS